MNSPGQDVLTIRHYSQLKPISCSVVSGSLSSFFTVRMIDTIQLKDHIVKGDPIIFGLFDGNDNISLCGGNVMAFMENEGSIVITPDKVFEGSDKRQFERFPVSLCGNLVSHYDGKKNRAHVYIKDMSYSGFRVYSEADLTVGANVEVDIFLHNNMLSITGTVMRKSVFYGRSEYGIQIIFRDKSAIYATQDFLDKLVVHEKDLIKKQLLKNLLSPHVK